MTGLSHVERIYCILCTYHYLLSFYHIIIVQVDYIDTSRNKVVLKMLPRIDYTYKRGALREEDGGRKRKKGKPMAKLLDQDAIKLVITRHLHVHEYEYVHVLIIVQY